MAPPATEIDRLIEDGLGLYGEGDLDGALLLWEQALSIDPENAQANSYVDYVRMNYELLTNDAQGEDSGPFGIAEDGPEYQIEILPGEDVEAGPSPRVATRDDGSWAIGDEADAHTRPTREALESGEDRERQIFATTPTEDLVPSDEHRALATFDSGPHDGVSFEDATREYPGGAGRPASALLHGGLPAPDLPTPEIGEFEPTITPPFGSVPSDVQTPQDFGAQLTDVRRRDLGFVQPTRTDLAVHPRPASQTSPPPTAEPPELKMTLRTPTPQPPIVPATPPAPEPYRPDPHRSATRDSDAPIDPAAIATSSALTLDLTVEPSAYDSLSLQAATDEPAPPTPPTIWPRRTAKLVGRDAFDDLDDGEPGDDDDNGDDDLDDLGDDAELAAGDLDDLEDADDPDDDPLDLLKTLPVPSRTPTGPTRQLPPKPRAPSDDPRLEDRRTREMPPEPRPAAMPPSSTARTQEIPYTIQLDPRLSIPADPQRPAVSATGTGLGLGAGPLTRDFSALPTPGPAPGPMPGPSPARAPTPPPTPAPRSPTAPSLPTVAPVLPGAPLPGSAFRADDPMIFAPTRELGLRTEKRPATEDEPTGELDAQKIRGAAPARQTSRPVLPGMDPIDARSAEILEEIDRAAPASETREDRTRRRITALLERATEWGRTGDVERSVAAVDLALSEDPNSALAQKLIHRNRDTIMNAFQGFLGDLQRTPSLARPLHELGSAPISPRAAFLLSRVDGTLSLDEILDVSGMPRLEAYRYLCQLFLRGILR